MLCGMLMTSIWPSEKLMPAGGIGGIGTSRSVALVRGTSSPAGWPTEGRVGSGHRTLVVLKKRCINHSTCHLQKEMVGSVPEAATSQINELSRTADHPDRRHRLEDGIGIAHPHVLPDLIRVPLVHPTMKGFLEMPMPGTLFQ